MGSWRVVTPGYFWAAASAREAVVLMPPQDTSPSQRSPWVAACSGDNQDGGRVKDLWSVGVVTREDRQPAHTYAHGVS